MRIGLEVAVAAALLLPACKSDTGSPLDRSALLHRESSEAGGVHLDASVNELIAHPTVATLDVDLRLGTDSLAGFGAIGDVASFDDGRVAVLDLQSRSIVLFASDGRRIRELGRGGQGPDEFQQPIAIAAFDSTLVVLQASTIRPLVRMGLDGRVVASASTPVAGDWRGMTQRGPMLMQDGMTATASGAEDVTRRLAVFGNRVLVLIQDADNSDSTVRTASHVLRFDSNLVLIDTLATLAPALIHVSKPGVSSQGREFYMNLFEQRPLLAASGNWVATGWSGDTSVRIRGADRASHIVSWPASHRRVTGQDRTDAAAWTARRTTLLVPGAAAAAASLSREEYAEQVKVFAAQLPFADAAPEFTAMYLTDDCLWLTGFAPHDQTDGTSLTLVGIGIKTGTSATVVRATRPDGRIRHVDGRGIYVSSLDSLGTPSIERFALPRGKLACGR